MSSVSIPIKKNNTTKYVLIGVGVLVAVIFVIVLIIIVAVFLLRKGGGIKLGPPTITNITVDSGGNNYIIIGTNFDEKNTKYQWHENFPTTTPILGKFSSTAITIPTSSLNNKFRADGVLKIKIITPAGSATYVVPKSEKVDANIVEENNAIENVTLANSGRVAIKIVFANSLTIPSGFYNAGKSGTTWFLRSINYVAKRHTALVTIEDDINNATAWNVSTMPGGGQVFTEDKEGYNLAVISSDKPGDTEGIPVLSVLNEYWQNFYLPATTTYTKTNEEGYQRQTFSINQPWPSGGGSGLTNTWTGNILDLEDKTLDYQGSFLANTAVGSIKIKSLVYKRNNINNRVALMGLEPHPTGISPLGPQN